MKKYCILFMILLLNFSMNAQILKYSKVKIFANGNDLLKVAKLGIAVEEGNHKKGEYYITDLSADEIIKLQEADISYEILISNVGKFYHERNVGKSSDIKDFLNFDEYEVPDGFEFGSMSGHATYDEMTVHLDSMFIKFPNLISEKESIGQTIEGREMWMVKISDNPEINESEPEVFYNAITHAREPAGLMTLLFYMYYLLENYDNDEFIKTLVDHTEMYFVPVVNPDGYVYNETNYPNGGGMWRKNRRNNGNGTWGVDLNRNYGYMWGYNNIGSSPDPGSQTYRGTEPFSEPEIQNIRDFCESHEFKTSINYHTYSNLLLYPWDYDYIVCPDDEILNAFGQLMIQDNNYALSQGVYLYQMNGSANDWQYGEQTTKEKMFSYLPELGSTNDGFWCPIDRIIPIAQENMIQNILLAAFAGSYAVMEELSPAIIGENTAYITFSLKRYGLQENTQYTISLTPISNVITATGDPVEFEGLEIMESITDSIEYTLQPSVPSGTMVQFLLTLDNGDYLQVDTLTKIFGEAVVLFEDDCNTLTNWESATWNITTQSFYSPTASITDSPNGNYPNNHTSTVVLIDGFDLSNVAYALLNFYTRWEIEDGYDYVQLQISTDNGTNWMALEGKYTTNGNSNQALGEPLYDGFQTEWVEEEIELTDFIGNTVNFRFMLKTDYSTTEDGFYFDDFSVKVVEFGATGLNNDMMGSSSILISHPIPNPANDKVQFNLSVPEFTDNLQFNIYNVSGQHIYSTQLSGNQTKLIIDINNWNSGIYYYQLEGTGLKTKAKKMVVIH